MGKYDPDHPSSGGSLGDPDEPRVSPDVSGSLNPTAAQIASLYRRDTHSPAMVAGIFRMVEFAVIAATGVAVQAAHVGFHAWLRWAYPLAILIGTLTLVALLEITGNYRASALRAPRITPMLLAWLAAFSAMAMVAFLIKLADDFSRLWFLGWMAASLSAAILLRLVLSRLIRRWARNGTMERRAVIVGGGPFAEDLIRTMERHPGSDIRICGIFDDRDDTRSPPVVAGYPKLGNIDELVRFARIASIDLLIVALPLTAERRVLSLLKRLWVLPVDIRLSAHASELPFHRRSYSFVGGVPMLDILDKPLTEWDGVAKRLFDIVFSILGILVFSPVMLATAIAIRLDSPGPILFRQKRHGFNNEIIEVLKFRSMYVDQCDPTARNAVTRNDPRVTRVGHFIRKTSIDELPQFFNALRGDLSLIGPRPHAISAQSRDLLYHEVVDGYFARHKVKPGVTGWAQINGWRGEIDSHEKIRMRSEFDLYYIENWSLWFDLKILFLTPIRLLQSENAY